MKRKYSEYNIFVFLLLYVLTWGEWRLVNPLLTGSWLRDVFFISPERGWIVGRNGIILHSNDSGYTWEVQNIPIEYPPPLLSVQFLNNDTGFAVGGVYGRSLALKTTDGGKNWEDVTASFPDGGLRKIYFYNKKYGWVLIWNRDPNLAFTTDGGENWQPQTVDNISPHDILFLDSLTGFLCGDRAYIGKTYDGGQTWVKKSSADWAVYNRIIFPSIDTG